MSYDIPVPPLMSGLRLGTSPIPHNSTTLATFLQRKIRGNYTTRSAFDISPSKLTSLLQRFPCPSPWTSPPWIIAIKIRNVWHIRVPATAAYDLTVRYAMIVLPPRQLRCARRVSRENEEGEVSVKVWKQRVLGVRIVSLLLKLLSLCGEPPIN